MRGVFPGTEEQEKIFKSFKVGTRHIVIKSVAGSGKTWTGIQCCKRDKKSDIAYVAFNKHIQVELASKIDQPNVECLTYHGLGYKALRKVLKNVELDTNKLDSILDKLIPGSKWDVGYLKAQTGRLVSLAKQYGVWDQGGLEKLVDHHTLEIRGLEDRIYGLVTAALHECRRQSKIIDFDDMVWLPRELGIKMPKFDIMLIDEAQDTNLAQQWLALNSADRLVVIGDPHQAIYGFRGSDVKSMDRIREELLKTPRGVRDRVLTETRRCPKGNVELAQKIVPNIKALDDAPQGSITSMDPRKAVDMMRPGDLALCRVNAPLMKTAYQLIKNDVKAVVRGRDIGNGVIKLIDKAEKRAGTSDIKEVLRYAEDICRTDAEKYRATKNGENRAMAVLDKFECLLHISTETSSTTEVKNRVNRLFSDFEDDGKPKNAVVIGTVHRTKGLEANRVFVLSPELIPFPASKKEWEVQQERNLAYVAVTRSLYNERSDGELIWCGQPSKLFTDNPVANSLANVSDEEPSDQSKFAFSEETNGHSF